jgi:hypothetical protein
VEVSEEVSVEISMEISVLMVSDEN